MRDADFKVGVALRQLVVCETECECDYWFTFFSGKAAVLFFYVPYQETPCHNRTLQPISPLIGSWGGGRGRAHNPKNSFQ